MRSSTERQAASQRNNQPIFSEALFDLVQWGDDGVWYKCKPCGAWLNGVEWPSKDFWSDNHCKSEGHKTKAERYINKMAAQKEADKVCKLWDKQPTKADKWLQKDAEEHEANSNEASSKTVGAASASAAQRQQHQNTCQLMEQDGDGVAGADEQEKIQVKMAQVISIVADLKATFDKHNEKFDKIEKLGEKVEQMEGLVAPLGDLLTALDAKAQQLKDVPRKLEEVREQTTTMTDAANKMANVADDMNKKSEKFKEWDTMMLNLAEIKMKVNLFEEKVDEINARINSMDKKFHSSLHEFMSDCSRSGSKSSDILAGAGYKAVDGLGPLKSRTTSPGAIKRLPPSSGELHAST